MNPEKPVSPPLLHDAFVEAAERIRNRTFWDDRPPEIVGPSEYEARTGRKVTDDYPQTEAVEAPSSPQEATKEPWRVAFDKLPRKARRALLGAAKRDTRRRLRAEHRELREARRAAGVAPWKIERLG